MIETNEPLNILPQDFQLNWQAELHRAEENDNGSFHVVSIRRTAPGTFEEGRIIVLVVDENGFPLSGVKVAFSYSTAHQYAIGQDFTWIPPRPRRADIVATEGSGQIEHIQGSVVQAGEPGGITVYCVEPKYSSDFISGAGALADHTGMHITFMLQRPGVVPLDERLAEIERRLELLEDPGMEIR